MALNFPPQTIGGSLPAIGSDWYDGASQTTWEVIDHVNDGTDTIAVWQVKSTVGSSLFGGVIDITVPPPSPSPAAGTYYIVDTPGGTVNAGFGSLAGQTFVGGEQIIYTGDATEPWIEIGGTLPIATTTQRGIVQLATAADIALNNNDKAVTPDMLSGLGSGSSGNFGYWSRTGTTLSPVNSGDNLDNIGSAEFTGSLAIGTSGGPHFTVLSADGSAYFDKGVLAAGGDIDLKEDGSATFAGEVKSFTDADKVAKLTPSGYAEFKRVGISASGRRGANYFNSSIDGSFDASFASGVTDATGSGNISACRLDSDGFAVGQSVTDTAALIKPDGSAEFAGYVSAQGLSSPGLPTGLDNSTFGTRIGIAGDGGSLPGYFITSRDVGVSSDVAVFYGNQGAVRIKGDGSATFAGTITSGDGTTTDGFLKINRRGELDTQAFLSLDSAGSNKVTIKADGSATFAGNVFGNRIFARSDTDVDTLVVGKKTGTSIEQGAAIIRNDGSATFAGDVDCDTNIIVGGNALSGSATGARMRAGGDLQLSASTGGNAILQGYTTGNSTSTVDIKANGSATFAGGIISGNKSVTTSYVEIYSAGQIVSRRDNANKDAAVWLGGFNDGNYQTTSEIKADGSATFADLVRTRQTTNGQPSIYATCNDTTGNTGSITADNSGGGNCFVAKNAGTSAIVWKVDSNGNSTFRNAIFNLEPDNPANYTTTTDSEGNETSVYNGPTLDVKDRLMNLISRLDAIEANEIIDDSTDTSLLQLVANASSRLDLIEQRLAALEGGN